MPGWSCNQNKRKRLRSERTSLLKRCHDSFAKTAAMNVIFEEDENRADWVVAKTRLGEMSLNIIPLEKDGNYVLLDASDEKI